MPTVTFGDRYTLKAGSQVLELSYHGNAHEPGNIFIYAPAQRTLMVVDVIFPGWMPFRRFAVAQDVEGYFAQVAEIKKLDFDTLVSGHVARTGTKADVDIQLEFMTDLKATVADALKSTKPGEEMDPARSRESLGGLRQLHRSRRDQVGQRPDPAVVQASGGFRRLHLGPVLLDGAEFADRVAPEDRRMTSENERIVRAFYDSTSRVIARG